MLRIALSTVLVFVLVSPIRLRAQVSSTVTIGAAHYAFNYWDYGVRNARFARRESGSAALVILRFSFPLSRTVAIEPGIGYLNVSRVGGYRGRPILPDVALTLRSARDHWSPFVSASVGGNVRDTLGHVVLWGGRAGLSHRLTSVLALTTSAEYRFTSLFDGSEFWDVGAGFTITL